MGSKSKYVNYIVPILQKIIDKENIKTYIEPFVGGANIIDKIKCEEKIGNDKNITLIALHQQGQKDNSVIPESGNSDWWYEAKDLYKKYQGGYQIEEFMPLWKVGAIEFFGSFCKGGFSRGYAKNVPGRDYYNEAYNSFILQTQKEEYKNIKFESGNYDKFSNCNNCLIYCDPPYQGTKTYGYAFESKFDYNVYWNWIREVSKNNFVVVSEQNLPEDFIILWEKEVKRLTRKDNAFPATEKLGIYKNGLLPKYLNKT